MDRSFPVFLANTIHSTLQLGSIMLALATDVVKSLLQILGIIIFVITVIFLAVIVQTSIAATDMAVCALEILLTGATQVNDLTLVSPRVRRFCSRAMKQISVDWWYSDEASTRWPNVQFVV